MNKVANVLFAYQPKNDDELELKVGDKIEVIGFEEEGWWKGRLHGRTGVFPSNFVQVNQETSSQSSHHTTSSIIAPNLLSSSTTNISASSATTNKLNFFGSRAAKTNSLSSNSLNSNSSLNNSHNFLNNNNSVISNNNRSLTMNNTRLDSNPLVPASHVGGASNGDDSVERKPKPIRGIGYGDIFAAGAKPKPRPGDHVVSPAMVEALQKQIPKKPPPPTPTNDNNGLNGSQAPALPPKPASQFSPHSMQHQHSRPQLPIQNSSSLASHKQQQVARERARVLFPYDPSNDDELKLQVGDIIDITDKEIEDAGWWKGELRGKVGVFPDNFVELISDTSNQNWLQNRPSSTSQPVTPVLNSTSSVNNANSEGRVRSVFSVTPKGFSKELENNLEKQQQQHSNNNLASFLSLKRNKLPSTGSIDNIHPNEAIEKKPDIMNINNENNHYSSTETSPTTRLNHITANRAKGPSRRPPTNLLNKKVAQNDQSARSTETNGKSEHNNPSQLASLPVTTPSSNQLTNHESMPSLSTASSGNQQPHLATSPATNVVGPLSKSNDSSPSADHSVAPKTSQRLAQPIPLESKNASSSASTPPWMVELRKAHAEKKRDTPVVPVAALQTTPIISHTNSVPTPSLDELLKKSERAPVKSELNQTPPSVVAATVASPVANMTPELSPELYDSLAKMISKSVASEVRELKEEVKQLRDDLKSVMEVRDALETMKLDLKICQSATENQKKYIKELVSNLADEHRKLAAMQAEIDRNLK